MASELEIYNPNHLLRYNASPFEVLMTVNPEIASVAYTNRQGILQPEVMPLIANFRGCQRDERIATLQAIVEHARIGSDERQNEVICKTQYGITQLQEEGQTARTSFRERGATQRTFLQEQGMTERTALQERGESERTQVQCSAALDMTRLKYESNVRIIRDQVEGQKYISDNELRATYIEATAQRDAIISSEKIRALVSAKESDNNLTGLIKQAELEYLTKIREAELIRATEQGKRSAEVINVYLATQAQIYRDATKYQILQARMKLGEARATYQGITEITKTLGSVLSNRQDAQGVSLTAQTPIGNIKVNLDIANGQSG